MKRGETGKLAKKNKKKLRYFYLNDELHKVLSIVNAQDLIVAWNFPQGKRVGYSWSDVRKRHKKAFTMRQVAAMIGRARENIERDILAGKIRRPQRAYSLDANRTPRGHFFSEEDVFGVHDYLLTIHIGRPRKDGKITPRNMPSKAELRAMMRHDIVTYVKSDSGEFVPVWKEVDW